MSKTKFPRIYEVSVRDKSLLGINGFHSITLFSEFPIIPISATLDMLEALMSTYLLRIKLVYQKELFKQQFFVPSQIRMGNERVCFSYSKCQMNF